jgi:hypothetical protein
MIMYGQDQPPEPKKGKKGKKDRKKDKEREEGIMSKMPPSHPTTDVS